MFTVGVVAYGSLIFAYVVAYTEGVGRGAEYPWFMELERSSGENANVASGLRRIFAEQAGLTVEQSANSVSVSGFLPADNGGYSQGISEYSSAVGRFLPGTSFHAAHYPAFTTDYGLNFSRGTGDEATMSFPAGVLEVILSGLVDGNVSSCSIDSSGGGLFFTGAFRGVDGRCERSANIGDLNSTVFAAGGFSAEVSEGTIRLRSTGPVTHYNLTLVFNESVRRKPPLLEASVSSSAGSARKNSGVSLL